MKQNKQNELLRLLKDLEKTYIQKEKSERELAKKLEEILKNLNDIEKDKKK